ncbi:MAG: lytic transglycosylase domain-containing protein [Rhodocyclaceae bacterium]
MLRKFLIFLQIFPFAISLCHAGNQQYEELSQSMKSLLHSEISDNRPMQNSFKSPIEAAEWLGEMSRRLSIFIADQNYRIEFLRSVHYESKRAGLDPQMVLALIQVESQFSKYAVSPVGARGYMQVMPFWIKVIGNPNDNLFHLRTNLRYGCVILRHYLDIENGNYFRALGRYNGSLGRAEYPNLIKKAFDSRWKY